MQITLQMTLLDGDGPFNYSTLMQSAVNTLNQAAEEEAAYPSSLPSPPLFPSLALSPYPLFSFPWSPSRFLCMVFNSSSFCLPSPQRVLSVNTVCGHSGVFKPKLV